MGSFMFDANEEKARLLRQMSQEAIALAMQGRWKEALTINENIIESIPDDVDAYNRLGKAYFELNEFDKAKEAYNKALEIAPNNTIAKKNIVKLSQLKGSKVTVKEDRPKASLHLFIGDVGKSGVINLQQIAATRVLAKITAGDQVNLKVTGQQLLVENEDGEYLGKVESQHGPRLAKMITAGNKYTAAIVSVDDNKVKVMIRETYHDPSYAGKLSFPATKNEGFQPHIKDTILREGAGDEEFPEEVEDEEFTDLEDTDLLPDGFSILGEDLSVETLADEELIDEEQ
jgi:tetratricopeptide (TPR) repeat protein